MNAFNSRPNLVVSALLFASALAFEAPAVEVWLNASGSQTAPYDTAETGFTTLAAAVSYLNGIVSADDPAATINVAAGTYDDVNVSITLPIVISGKAGSGTALFKNTSAAYSRTSGAIVVDHPRAGVENVSFSGASHTGLFLKNGYATNCVFTGWTKVGGPVARIAGGRLADSTFTRNVGYGAYGAASIYVTGGAVTNCLFSLENHMQTVAYVTAGTFSGCTVTNCNHTGTGHGNLPNNSLTLTGGQADRCLFWKNGTSGSAYEGNGVTYDGVRVNGGKVPGTVTVLGGLLSNCLLFGNNAKARPGLYVNGGRAANCTVGAHGAIASTADGTGLDLWLVSGSVINTIVYGNPNASDGGIVATGGTISHSLVSPHAGVTGVGLIANMAPDFADAPAGDYRLKKTSPCRDAGETVAELGDGTFDLAGGERVQNGIPDIGCYELEPLDDDDVFLTLGIVSKTLHDDYEQTFVVEAALVGPNTSGFTFDWHEDGATIGTAQTLERRFPLGTHDVGVTCRRGDLVLEDSIRLPVYGRCIYVSAQGSNVAPYATPATALNDFAELPSVLDDAGDAFHEVVVAEETYPVATMLAFNQDCFIHSAGSARAVLDLGSAAGHVSIRGSQTRIEGFSIRKGGAGALNVSAGVARDIDISQCVGNASAVVAVGGGRVERISCDGASGSWAFNQPAILVSDGQLSDFLVTGAYGCEAALIVTGGVASNGVIRGTTPNFSRGNLPQNSLSIRGGLVTHCVVTNNGDIAKARNGTVDISNGTLRNCLLAGNRNSDCTGIYMTGGTVESCTVAVESSAPFDSYNNVTYSNVLTQVGGTVENTLFVGEGYRQSGGTRLCNRADTALAGEGNVVDAPGFVSGSGTPYALPATSPLARKGRREDWMSGSEDLAGNPRLRGGHPSIGAFEAPSAASVLTVR